MIIEFGKLIKQFDPSFITGFNDSSYDIPFLRDKMEWCSNKNGVKDL
jgi:DNA polymerase elongation subunit (family B)